MLGRRHCDSFLLSNNFGNGPTIFDLSTVSLDRENWFGTHSIFLFSHSGCIFHLSRIISACIDFLISHNNTSHITDRHMVFSSAWLLLNWGVSNQESVQCSVLSVECQPGRANGWKCAGQSRHRPDYQRIRSLEFNLLFIETQLEWEFEVGDGWMLDCSITRTQKLYGYARLKWGQNEEDIFCVFFIFPKMLKSNSMLAFV